MWDECIAPVLLEFDFKPGESDHSIFVSNKDGRMTYIALYVDDLLILGDDDEDVAKIKKRLSAHEMKDLGEATRFRELRLNIRRMVRLKFTKGITLGSCSSATAFKVATPFLHRSILLSKSSRPWKLSPLQIPPSMRALWEV